jgi:hypothetical protein
LSVLVAQELMVLLQLRMVLVVVTLNLPQFLQMVVVVRGAN